MSKVFIVLWMIFFHIVDDYHLQGWLASAKQKDWWKKNAPNPLYKYDYVWALLMHSFSWAFMVMLPIAYYLDFSVGMKFVIVLWFNAMTHAFIDDCKANKLWINLWTDQIAHLCQIAIIAGVML